jgi:hypothetical protein
LLDPPALVIAMALDIVGMSRALLSCWPHCGLDPLVDLDPKVREIDRLGEQTRRGALNRPAASLCVAIGGDHDDRHVGPRLPRLGRRSRPLMPGMLASERIRIRLAFSFGDYFKRLDRRARGIHREPGCAQIAAELLAKQVLDIGLVVNDENERVQ